MAIDGSRFDSRDMTPGVELSLILLFTMPFNRGFFFPLFFPPLSGFIDLNNSRLSRFLARFSVKRRPIVAQKFLYRSRESLTANSSANGSQILRLRMLINRFQYHFLFFSWFFFFYSISNDVIVKFFSLEKEPFSDASYPSPVLIA